MSNIKRIAAIILLVMPLTFFGQGKGNYKFRQNVQPITRVKQSFDNDRNFDKSLYLIATIGPTVLQGDNGSNYKLGFGGNLGLGYHLNKYIGVEAKLGYATLNGDFSQLKSHEASIIEANVNLMIDLTNMIFGVNNSRRLSVVPHIGLGQVQGRSHVVYNNGREVSFGYKYYLGSSETLKNGKVDGTFAPYGSGIGGRIVALDVPVGIQIGYKFSKSLKMRFDFITNYVDSDLIDGIPRGEAYDWYSTLQVSFQYRFYKKSPSPCDNLFNNYR